MLHAVTLHLALQPLLDQLARVGVVWEGVEADDLRLEVELRRGRERRRLLGRIDGFVRA